MTWWGALATSAEAVVVGERSSVWPATANPADSRSAFATRCTPAARQITTRTGSRGAPPSRTPAAIMWWGRASGDTVRPPVPQTFSPRQGRQQMERTPPTLRRQNGANGRPAPWLAAAAAASGCALTLYVRVALRAAAAPRANHRPVQRRRHAVAPPAWTYLEAAWRWAGRPGALAAPLAAAARKRAPYGVPTWRRARAAAWRPAPSQERRRRTRKEGASTRYPLRHASSPVPVVVVVAVKGAMGPSFRISDRRRRVRRTPRHGAQSASRRSGADRRFLRAAAGSFLADRSIVSRGGPLIRTETRRLHGFTRESLCHSDPLKCLCICGDWRFKNTFFLMQKPLTLMLFISYHISILIYFKRYLKNGFSRTYCILNYT